MKTKYTLMLIFENMDGYKIIGLKEGCDPEDHISKHDKILDDKRGIIGVSGDIDMLEDYIEVNTEYYLTWEEKQEYEND